MNFKDFSLKEHTCALDFKNYKLKNKEDCRSERQFKLGNLLAEIYGRNKVLEDYPLPGCGNLSWDFWIPHSKIAFEFDGRQHDEFVKFFHGTRDGFLKQKNADNRKQRIADINNIKLITLKKDVTLEELKKIIIEESK